MTRNKDNHIYTRQKYMLRQVFFGRNIIFTFLSSTLIHKLNLHIADDFVMFRRTAIQPLVLIFKYKLQTGWQRDIGAFFAIMITHIVRSTLFNHQAA